MKPDLSVLGAFTANSVTLEKRAGNPNPRIAECVSGVFNSIGIQRCMEAKGIGCLDEIRGKVKLPSKKT
jgi:dihydroorotate dehydrogenase